MVHALLEIHRVLRPGGVLIDLRPSAVHRHVGVERARRYKRLAVMRERFHDERAADRAVAAVVHGGWFDAGTRTRFPCRRIMDTMSEFQAFLDESVGPGKWPPHVWLIRQLAHHLKPRGVRTRIEVRGPIDLRVLLKASPQLEPKRRRVLRHESGIDNFKRLAVLTSNKRGKAR